ncbi:signal transduction diguanylate cyclase [Oleiphilus messinensis]|uniref:diguanylate cyclase n=1 Tax=Oleiphilus messinensis TaxID=141451 RepID=A0A1Y0ID32_9GAMM|nr:diguanylate cyclase [Oleiphilus messinensis]ARU58160.1 signal transduction diguanylate cyclase [Oleiphilus messinensis]
MSQTEINHHLRAKIYFGAALSAAFLACAGLLSGRIETGLIALIFSVLLALNTRFLMRPEKLLQQQILAHIIIIFLALVTLSSAFFQHGLAEQWAYLFPVIVFFIYPVKPAGVVVAIYSLLFALQIGHNFYGPVKIQLLINYLFCLMLTIAFVYLREVRERQLKPLRRTDNLTLASTREHLANDLSKEIQRSEREGSALSLLALTVDTESQPVAPNSGADSHESLLQQLGRTLHEELRLFDSYYRYEDQQFLITLPHTSTQDAIKKADRLRLTCKTKLANKISTKHNEQPGVTVSVGVTGLNVGDDADTMIRRALLALRKAQRGGANRTSTYIDDDQFSDDDALTLSTDPLSLDSYGSNDQGEPRT